MSAAQQIPFVTEQEYLAAELVAERRSEYLDGTIVAIPGASLIHASITQNCLKTLEARMPASCDVYLSAVRIQAPQVRSYFYPDVLVVCGPILLAETLPDTVTNPTLIIEVLSPSTDNYDRGDKFHFYRTIDTLQQYTVLWQTEARAEVYTRRESGWVLSDISGLDATLPIPSLQCELPFQDLYQRVVFPPAETES